MLPDHSNHIFQLAAQFVKQTSRPIFLTGKAGTGKTTFLKYIRENSFKKMAVVAPTGVAAINAGGVTMHSFFQLPFGPYLPGSRAEWGHLNPSFTDQHSLFKNIRFNASKRELLLELELLVIDEVSMVRADTLDAIDTILRHFRQQPLAPFGGLQVLYIGDLFQLPPVVGRDEWEVLKEHYRSPFFFDALVLQEAPPLYLELDKIYRQNEADFISILNNIRYNRITGQDLERLHEYYQPDFQPARTDNYITLTSHNAKADEINQRELSQLPGRQYAFEASLLGEFNDKAYPAEKKLCLKEGAQVMFIKNDKGETRRYFNGKIGIVKKLNAEKIQVSFPGEPDDLVVEKETWKNIRYNYDKAKDHIEEEELGSFSQYPLRLAWAITIHKSQGLTFQKAIIDAGTSFAAGQVYVALSRLTAIQGLILRSRIQRHAIQTDERVIAFTGTKLSENILREQLQEEQKAFIGRSLIQSFHWSRLLEALENNMENPARGTITDKKKAYDLARTLLANANTQHETALKFTRQLEQILLLAPADGYRQLKERIEAASGYFTRCLEDELIQPLHQHMDALKGKQKVKKYLKTQQDLKVIFNRKKQQLEQTRQIVTALAKGENAIALLAGLEKQRKIQLMADPNAGDNNAGPINDPGDGASGNTGNTGNDNPSAPRSSSYPRAGSSANVHGDGDADGDSDAEDFSEGIYGYGSGSRSRGINSPSRSRKTSDPEGASSRPKKGNTNRTSLDLFKEGLSPEEIAARRNLALSTIETHLASFIATGEVDIKEFVSERKLAAILAMLGEMEGQGITPIRVALGNSYSYGEIRAAMQYRTLLSGTKGTKKARTG